MQQGGSQYGVSPVSYAGSQGHMLDQQQQQQGEAASAVLAEAASPISSRPPAGANFDELGSSAGGFPDEDALVGDDVERGATSGNRWPRQETLALLKIRSDMDATFKEATLKGPLWEDVSRKLAEFGYNRNAKKCKEKFENVQKYYKRTKEGRAGRQDSKNYRFSSQLEALHSSNTSTNTTSITATTTTTPAVPISVIMVGNNPMVGSSIPAPALATSQRPGLTATTPAAGVYGADAGFSFSPNTSSSSGSEEEDDDDDTEEGLNMDDRRKRRRTQMGSGCNKKMMVFFERLMKEVVEKQEGMLQRFIETIEKREQDRMIREEAWKRQEMARLTREQEIMAQERAISASRDAALIAFLQQITGQSVQIITQIPIHTAAPPLQPNPSPPPPQLQAQQQQQQPQQQQSNPPPQLRPQQPLLQSQVTEAIRHRAQSSELVLIQQEQPETMGVSIDPTSSRWPKAEVLALIKLRTRLESKYHESGPKGPLWEDISIEMQQLGYKRSSKRCKEKWENINKYFKKVKESKKKRPEDAKTCPYFHELDALYRSKLLKGGATGLGANQEQEMDPGLSSNPQEAGHVLAIMPPPESQTAIEIKTNNNKNGGNSGVGSSLQIETTSNGGLPPSYFEEGSVQKPEDIVKELMGGDHHDQKKHNHHHSEQQQAAMEHYNKLDDSDNIDQDDEDENDDDDDFDDDDDDNEGDGKMAYKIQYQRPNPSPSAQGNPSAGSFLAVVQ
ncbi:hypothetical protein AAC387_Pa08g0752 [Persea americana]